MNDLIYRQTAMDVLEERLRANGHTNVALVSELNRSIEYLMRLPSAEAEPVRHGRWERKEDPYGFFDTIPVCSACGCTTKYRETSAYCPHCGARMDGE